MSDRVELSSGGSVTIRRERVGRDSLKSLTIRAKLQDSLPEYNVPGGFLYQSDFADLVTQVEGVEGVDYQFPPWDAPGEVLAEAFELWLSLPEAAVIDMRNALKSAAPLADKEAKTDSKKKSDKS